MPQPLKLLRGMILGVILGLCGIYFYQWQFWVLLVAAFIFGGIYE